MRVVWLGLFVSAVASLLGLQQNLTLYHSCPGEAVVQSMALLNQVRQLDDGEARVVSNTSLCLPSSSLGVYSPAALPRFRRTASVAVEGEPERDRADRRGETPITISNGFTQPRKSHLSMAEQCEE